MRFVRERQLTTTPQATLDANGNPTTQTAETRAPVETLILGNGSSTFDITVKRRRSSLYDHTKVDEDGNELLKDVQSVAIPATFGPECEFFVNFNGGKDVGSKIWLMLHVEALGTLTEGRALIEFQDSDHPAFWFPSLDGVARDAAAAAYEIPIDATGDFIFLTREEHTQFTRARIRFRVEAGAVSADTKIIASWSHSGGIAVVPEQY